LIDDRAMGPLQYRAFALAGLAILMDGYDTQAAAYVAPIISKEWALPAGAFGSVFAAGLIGSALGSLALAPLADRTGRKRVIVGSTIAIGLFTTLCTSAHSLHALELLRFLTGLGLGAALPNALALISEYAPERKRTSVVAITFCGLPIGAALGAVVATQLAPRSGWQSVFITGGLATLILCPVLQRLLPESLAYLVLREPRSPRTLAILGQLKLPAPAVELVARQPADSAPGFASLFRDGRAVVTITYGSLAFFTLLTLYLLNNWLPTLIHAMGFQLSQASWATAGFQLGGILGAVSLGILADRFDPVRVVVIAYAAAAIVIVAIAFASGPSSIALAACAAGFTVVGAQSCNNAMVATLYPTSSRGTALGLNLTIGRIGSIIGPSVTGLLLQRHVTARQVLIFAALPAVCAVIVLLLAGNPIRKVARSSKSSVC
jgi:AAHS family 4-hydroxybenzoate transporter-like MFS transporter